VTQRNDDGTVIVARIASWFGVQGGFGLCRASYGTMVTLAGML
jgi:hypothetical protein